MRNNNRAIILKLSSKSLKSNRTRNFFAIFAIILTCMLFTAVFSMFSGMIQASQEATMHEIGGRFHAGIKKATEEQYKKITADPMIKDSNYSILIGYAKNIIKRQVELRYMPYENALSDWFITLQEGHMPKEKDEILVDTFAMDALHIPHAIGEKISFVIPFLGKEIEKEFTISGYYKGDPISHASELFISKEFWLELKGDWTDVDFKAWGEKHPEDNSVGLMAINLFFDNTFHLEEKVQKVIRNAGYEPGTEVDYGINWAYMSNRLESVDPLSALLIAAALLVILLTGYLIIYNIFQISVLRDIRFYGLLKTIGTTKKQLQGLILRQVLMLCVIGIPIGLIFGYAIGKVGLPIMISFLAYGDMEISLNFDPMIFIFGAGFSLVTVYLSCRKPEKIAGMVSPVEAVKYVEIEIDRGKREKKVQNKRHRKFSLISMALSNLNRNKKKTNIVILAISLSIILLTLMITGVGSFRIERFLEERIVGDIMLESANLLSTVTFFSNYELDEEYVELARQQKGIQEENEMWIGFGKNVKLDEKGKKRFQKLDQEEKLVHDNEYKIQETFSTGLMNGYVYGYTDELLKNIKVLEGTLDIEKFQSGDYILLGQFFGIGESSLEDALYRPGDKVRISNITENSKAREIKNEDGETIDVSYDNREEKEYEVMALIALPYSMNLHRYNINAMDVVLPRKEFINNSSINNICFARSFQIEEQYLSEFEATIKEYTESKNPYMGYASKSSLEKEFRGMVNAIATIGIVLAGVIALIGILNFINAVFTSIISRKREFAMLQSIGMTASQLRGMMIYEGVSYVIIASVISLCFGSLFSYVILNAFNHILVCFEYRFQILPFLIMIPILIAMAVLTPIISFQLLQKHSIVERLREVE